MICLNVIFSSLKKFISRYYFVRSKTSKMDQLFNFSNHVKLIKLCKYVEEIFIIFK